ncbi:hypothetical protein AB0F17_62465 [Nonomuraea sp. NPDC026600]|uniref:hypothetical protein n=1 Tax=Nonomuraea sp. NPDC026600 TaxID=3155363 RepID=UPI003402E5BB
MIVVQSRRPSFTTASCRWWTSAVSPLEKRRYVWKVKAQVSSPFGSIDVRIDR